MSRLEKKDVYTYEDLTKHKLTKKEQSEKLFKSLVKLQFECAGHPDKDLDWAKTHSTEELPWYNLIYITKEQENDFKEKLANVFNKQLGLNKKTPAMNWEISMYLLACGFDAWSFEEWRTCVTERLEKYKENHDGHELTFPDGYENDIYIRLKA